MLSDRLILSRHLMIACAWGLLSAGCSSAGPVAIKPPPTASLATTAPVKPSPEPDDAVVTKSAAEPATERTAKSVVEPADTTSASSAPVKVAKSLEATPATPASFDTPPSTQPSALSQPTSAPAVNLIDAFDEQLVRVIHGDTSGDSSLNALPADERELLSTVADSLASFRQTLKDPSSLMATRVAPLIELSDRIRAQTPLSIPTLALCRSVTQFGVYEAFEAARFTAGKETPVVVYCELDNFASRPSNDGRWETTLSYEAVLYSDNEHSVPVITKKATTIVDRCRNRRRDFFLADRLNLPATLPVGKYVLKVTVVDQLANHVAEKSVPILVAPN